MPKLHETLRIVQKSDFPLRLPPSEIDLQKLKRLKLGNVYIKDLAKNAEGALETFYSPFGAIIAACFSEEEEYRLMQMPIKFKLFFAEYEPMQHIRWKLAPREVKAIEANTNLKEALTQGLKLLLKGKLVKLRDDQLELAEEFGLASI